MASSFQPPTQTWVVVGESLNDTTLLISNLPPSAHLVFLVRAVNSHGTSLPSSVTSVVTTKCGKFGFLLVVEY